MHYGIRGIVVKRRGKLQERKKEVWKVINKQWKEKGKSFTLMLSKLLVIVLSLLFKYQEN
jgi:hypothetical protein